MKTVLTSAKQVAKIYGKVAHSYKGDATPHLMDKFIKLLKKKGAVLMSAVELVMIWLIWRKKDFM